MTFRILYFPSHRFLFFQTLAVTVYYVSQKPLLRHFEPIACLAYCYVVAAVLMGATALLLGNNDALLALARAVADEEVDAAPGTERPDRRCS